MRTLVEQTLDAVRAFVAASGHEVNVIPCMGGLVDKEYSLQPHVPTILVGTQDMLISRCLNRGYAAARGRWPIDFGLLSRDCLMVCDEVQLMDASLPTSCQLAAFRGQDGLRPSRTWWMSATLQPKWLHTVDHSPFVAKLEAATVKVRDENRVGGIWDNEKTLVLKPELTLTGVAQAVMEAHEPGTLSLIIVNQVKHAVEVVKCLKKSQAKVHLVHSRFRPAERASWAKEFLSKDSPMPAEGRIVVSTQVVEAGVDISAKLLVTAMAPWSSLVQRFGRAGRRSGEAGEVWVFGGVPVKVGEALPYSLQELGAASESLARLEGASISNLERYEEGLSAAERAVLYPQPDCEILRRADLNALFDTTPDLSGADIDVAPFIRSGVSRDFKVFWREVDELDAKAGKSNLKPASLPRREELCSVPVSEVKWLASKRWWLLDYSEGWIEGKKEHLGKVVPGRVVRVHCDSGGYTPEKGFDKSKKAVVAVPVKEVDASVEATASTDSNEALSQRSWRTIATHGRETAEYTTTICEALGIPDELTYLLALAGRWHDTGKSHPVFQGCLKESHRQELAEPERQDLAKGPKGAWRFASRRGFRHELASALGLMELLRQAAPEHVALRGAVKEVLEALSLDAEIEVTLVDNALADELVDLSADQFDLLLWLVVTHHGKIRCSWVSTPNDQKMMVQDDEIEVQIHGVRNGDRLPTLAVQGPNAVEVMPELVLSLSAAQVGLDAVFGRSWPERSADLLKRWGPFDLAYLESLLRAADATASQIQEADRRIDYVRS